MPDAAWKRHEREIADLLGGRRLPRPRGSGSSLVGVPPATPNVVAGRWRLQVRSNLRLPRWLDGALGLVRRHSLGGHRGALVVVRSSQGVPTERWAVLPFDEFRALLERAGDLDEPIPTPPKKHAQPLFDDIAILRADYLDQLERWHGPDPHGEP